jgi:4-amino-4-deoxy-L-arabinose transferase-like glycosyltransferase
MMALALPRSTPEAALPSPVLVAVALVCALVLPNPVGYVGGGGDDWYYVEAARCAAAHGWCVPDTHWATRWPLVAPMAAVFALLGDGAWQAMVVPFAYSLMAVVLFTTTVERVWGRPVALVAGVAFVATASFAKGLLQPNVETVELAWLLAAVAMGQAAYTARDSRRAILAGVLLAIAMQARMTSLAWLPILALGVILVPADRRKLALPALLGVALPLGIEALAYGLWAGDPLLSQHLSAAHTRIASSELPASVDLTRSPLFNPQFIGGWHPAMGIDLHWTVNGIVNLLANPQMGPVLLAALVLLWLRRKALTARSPEVLLAAAAMLYTGALIYALAIDPKARMFLPVAAIAAALIGRLVVAAWDAGERLLVGGIIAVLLMVGAVETAKRFDMGKAAPLAGQWAREHPGRVAVEDATRRFLTFDATVRALPVYPPKMTDRLIVLVADQCGAARRPAGWQLVRDAGFGRPNDPLTLCEFSRANPAAPLRP